MKKLIFFIVLFGIAFKLKAQQKPSIKPFEKLFMPNKSSLFDTVPKLSIKQQNDLNALFLPKKKIDQNQNLIADLDKMPIAKPTGNWNMPIVHPDKSMIYKMPVIRLPAVIKPDLPTQNFRP